MGHEVQQLGDVPRGHRLHEPRLVLGPEVAHDLGPAAGRQQADDGVAVAGAQVVEDLRHPRGVHPLEEIDERRRLAGADQLAEVGDQQRVPHGDLLGARADSRSAGGEPGNRTPGAAPRQFTRPSRRPAGARGEGGGGRIGAGAIAI